MTYSGQNRIKNTWRGKKTLERLNDVSGRTHLHLPLALFAAVFIHFVPEFLSHPSPPPPPPLPRPSLSPSIYPAACTLSPACISSGHGSLSQLQQGCVGTGYLSYCPAPTPLLKKHKYAKMCTSVNIQAQEQCLVCFPFLSHIKKNLTQFWF